MEDRQPPTLIVFWDYDAQWGADRSRSPGGPKDWGRFEFPNTDRLLELHAQYNIPACFAVVGAAALHGDHPYHDPAQIRRIHAAGHEVASHSFYHEWLPGLGKQALVETLSKSKDALEQCIGAPVTTFVPPYNQPFDCAERWSFSLSERRETNGHRTDLRGLCDGLIETGYSFCRVAYRPMHQRLAEFVLRRRLDRPVRLEEIAGIKCLRINTAGGFGSDASTMLNRCAEGGGMVVVYGHPHSLHSGDSQDETRLVPFLQRLQILREQGLIRICLPRQLL